MSRVLPAFAERVRRDDRATFFATLTAPAAHRETLLLIAAFDLEIAAAARRRTELAGPYPALIRLQWWRDLIEGRTSDPNHDVAAPLHAALAAGRIASDDLLLMLDGREAQAEGVPDWPAWRTSMLHGAGGASIVAARLLGVDHPERVACVGAARAALLTRSEKVPFLPAQATADATTEALAHELATLLSEAGKIRLPRRQRAVLLPLHAAARIGPNPRHPTASAAQLAMLRAWLLGASLPQV